MFALIHPKSLMPPPQPGKSFPAFIGSEQRFGIKHVVDVLRGADTERIRTFNHDRLTTYGIGEEHTHAEWTSIARQLIHRGYLVQDIANYSVLKLTPQALPLLRGEEATGTGGAPDPGKSR